MMTVERLKGVCLLGVCVSQRSAHRGGAQPLNRAADLFFL